MGSIIFLYCGIHWPDIFRPSAEFIQFCHCNLPCFLEGRSVLCTALSAGRLVFSRQIQYFVIVCCFQYSVQNRGNGYWSSHENCKGFTDTLAVMTSAFLPLGRAHTELCRFFPEGLGVSLLNPICLHSLNVALYLMLFWVVYGSLTRPFDSLHSMHCQEYCYLNWQAAFIRSAWETIRIRNQWSSL